VSSMSSWSRSSRDRPLIASSNMVKATGRSCSSRSKAFGLKNRRHALRSDGSGRRSTNSASCSRSTIRQSVIDSTSNSSAKPPWLIPSWRLSIDKTCHCGRVAPATRARASNVRRINRATSATKNPTCSLIRKVAIMCMLIIFNGKLGVTDLHVGANQNFIASKALANRTNCKC
jgi:hypothetical protein